MMLGRQENSVFFVDFIYPGEALDPSSFHGRPSSHSSTVFLSATWHTGG